MSEHGNLMTFSEKEKQALTVRLQAAARTAGPAARPRLLRRTVVVCAAAALTVAAAGAYSAGGFSRPLFSRTDARLTVNDQTLPGEARMKLNEDGSATITVDGMDRAVVITAPPATVRAMLAGETDGGFTVSRLDGSPYELAEQGGRLWLFVNERIPLDVTDLLEEGYTFSYTDENGAQQSATVSGTKDDYTVR